MAQKEKPPGRAGGIHHADNSDNRVFTHNVAAVNIANHHHAVTMCSREIAELTGKQHKYVLEDCRKYSIRLIFNRPTFRLITKKKNRQL